MQSVSYGSVVYLVRQMLVYVLSIHNHRETVSALETLCEACKPASSPTCSRTSLCCATQQASWTCIYNKRVGRAVQGKRDRGTA